MRVNVAPEKGKANEELIRLLHDTLDVAHDDIMIVRGHGSRDKLVEISGLDETELDRRLSDAVGKTG